jgi:hypothetical protein
MERLAQLSSAQGHNFWFENTQNVRGLITSSLTVVMDIHGGLYRLQLPAQ